MSDIVERLREETVLEDYGDGRRLVRWAHPLAVEAADEIERLRAALKPFAYYASLIPDDISDTCSASGTVGDLRAALKALGENELVIEISVINDI